MVASVKVFYHSNRNETRTLGHLSACGLATALLLDLEVFLLESWLNVLVAWWPRRHDIGGEPGSAEV